MKHEEDWMNRSKLTGIAAGIALALAATLPAQAQEGFQNLQVLPKDITKQELRATMDGFADQLDVKCSFCHVADEYPKDDKEHKQIARRMLKLVMFMRENSSDYFKDGIDPQQINCWSCHRGKSEPEHWIPEE
jgi:hypothetical protein